LGVPYAFATGKRNFSESVCVLRRRTALVISGVSLLRSPISEFFNYVSFHCLPFQSRTLPLLAGNLFGIRSGRVRCYGSIAGEHAIFFKRRGLQSRLGYKQYPRYGQPGFHHIAIEAGAGFGAPLANTSKTQTFGYNIKLGGGWNFNRRFGLLVEYEFNRNGIPENVLRAVGAPDGHVHLWGFGLDPIVYYKTTGAWGGYVTGGAGFTRKTTAFTATVFTGSYYCDFYGYCYPNYATVDLGHFSSNQLGLNIGTGLTHNIGDGGAKLYAEARYLWANSPASSPGHIGSGTVSMIPVTFGVRF
jgi:hypothetical protein